MADERSRIPLGVKLIYTAFVAVLVPAYWRTYGPTNFLYFCDIAVFLALAALWMEKSLWASAAAVGIIVSQLVWQVDFLAGLAGVQVVGISAYMFDPNYTLFIRALSFFHFWIPLLLVWIVWRLGYDRRGLIVWTLIAWVAILVSYVWLPAPPAPGDNPNLPVNVNYVYGLDSANPQTWLHPDLYVALMMVALPLVVFLPTHLVLKRVFPPAAENAAPSVLAV